MYQVLERPKTSKISEKGQTTVPKPVRDVLGLESGDHIEYVIEGGVVMLSRAEVHHDPLFDAFLSFLEKDMEQQPGALQGIPASLAERIAELTQGVDGDPRGEIKGPVDI